MNPHGTRKIRKYHQKYIWFPDVSSTVFLVLGGG
jgi:hypothetical protein